MSVGIYVEGLVFSSLQLQHPAGPAPVSEAVGLRSGPVRPPPPRPLCHPDGVRRQDDHHQRNAGVSAGRVREERTAVHGRGRLQLRSGETLQGLMGNHGGTHDVLVPETEDWNHLNPLIHVQSLNVLVCFRFCWRF